MKKKLLTKLNFFFSFAGKYNLPYNELYLKFSYNFTVPKQTLKFNWLLIARQFPEFVENCTTSIKRNVSICEQFPL